MLYICVSISNTSKTNGRPDLLLSNINPLLLLSGESVPREHPVTFIGLCLACPRPPWFSGPNSPPRRLPSTFLSGHIAHLENAFDDVEL